MNLDYQRHKQKHPQNTFADFYAETIAAKVKAGRRHNSLSLTPLDPDRRARNAERRLQRLIKLGLEPGDVCVDYGCGSLGAAAPLIQFLDPGNYIGMDVTDYFFQIGLQRFCPEYLKCKQPQLHVISPASLSAVHARQPQFAVAHGVANHVPPFELADFVKKFLGVLRPDGIGVFTFIEGSSLEQKDERSWRYPRGLMGELVAKHGGRTDERRLRARMNLVICQKAGAKS